MSQDVIIIVRHGRPALSRKVWLTWREYIDWWKQYDAGGLAFQQRMPEAIKTLADKSDFIFSSPLRRAVETARLAAGREPDDLDPDFIEAALPPPHLWNLKFRPKTWGALARISWYFGWSDGLESHNLAKLRAERAAKKLQDAAQGGKTVMLTAHGWYNRMLKSRLERQGWTCIKQTGDNHWSYRIFERPTHANTMSEKTPTTD